MRVDTRPRKRNAPRIAEKSAPGFLQWLRGRACMAFGPACMGGMEAAHVDYAGGKGVGSKVRDSAAVPMCSYHHSLQHRWGWKRFEKALYSEEGYALKAAEAYWHAWPGRIAWERKLADG